MNRSLSRHERRKTSRPEGLTMSRVLSGSKRPASRSRASFRPQLEVLEGRALLSGQTPLTPPVQEIPQTVTNADHLTLLETGRSVRPQVVRSPTVVTVDQSKLRADDLQLDVAKGIRQQGTPIDLRDTAGRAEGIVRAVQAKT